MIIKQLFALMFVTTAFAIPVEQTKQNIKAEMLKLDQKIFNLYKEARNAKSQIDRKQIKEEINPEEKQTDQESEQISKELAEYHQKIRDLYEPLQECWDQRSIERKTLSWYQSYTVNCDDLQEAYDTYEKDNRKKYNTLQKKQREILNKKISSFNQTNRHIIAENNTRNKFFLNHSAYELFEKNFHRCERLNNAECFTLLEEALREWNKNN